MEHCNHLSFGEEEDSTTRAYADVISQDLNEPIITKEKDFSGCCNQLFEHQKYNNQLCVQTSLSTTMNHTILAVQDSCLTGSYSGQINIMDNEAFQSHLMVMLAHHCSTLASKIIFSNSTKTRSTIHQIYDHSHKVSDAPLKSL